MQKRNLPAVVSPEVTVLEWCLVAPEPKKESGAKVIWTRVLKIDYKTAIGSLMPVMSLVDNSDLLLVEPIKRGSRKVTLSLVDFWDGQSPFPNLSMIYRLITKNGKEAAGIAELSRFAEIMKDEETLFWGQHLSIIAPRAVLSRGEYRESPSMSYDQTSGVALGLTHEWMIERHHALVLVIN